MPGAISGSVIVRKARSGAARRVCAASSRDGLTPSATADEHQDRDRRQRQRLREPNARQAVDPSRAAARRRPIRSSAFTAPERPNSMMSARPMTNGGVIIGSTESTPSAAPHAQARSREQRSRSTARAASPQWPSGRRAQRVPHHALAAPDAAARHAGGQRRKREVAVDESTKACASRRSSGYTVKSPIERDAGRRAAVATKRIAPHEAAQRKTPAERRQQGGGQRERAVAEARLPARQRPEQARERRPRSSRRCRWPARSARIQARPRRAGTIRRVEAASRDGAASRNRSTSGTASTISRGANQSRPWRSSWNSAGAVARSNGKPASHWNAKKPRPPIAFHGSAAKPIHPRTSQPLPMRRISGCRMQRSRARRGRYFGAL